MPEKGMLVRHVSMLVLRVSCKRIEKKKKVEIPYRHISHTHDAFRTPIRVNSLCLCFFFFFRAHVCTNSILYTTYCTTTNTHLTHVVTHLGYQLGLIHSIFFRAHVYANSIQVYYVLYSFLPHFFFEWVFFFFLYFFFLGECQQLVNFWHKSSPFSSQPFSWREMKTAGAAGTLKRVRTRCGCCLCHRCGLFCCVCLSVCYCLYWLYSTFCFIALLCFSFCSEISRYFLAGNIINHNNHSFFKNFSSAFFCFSCSFSFCAVSSCSPFCVRAILVLDLVTGTCQLLLCTLCVCVSWTK